MKVILNGPYLKVCNLIPKKKLNQNPDTKPKFTLPQINKIIRDTNT